MSMGANMDEISNHVAAGLLTFGGDNLCYAHKAHTTMETQFADVVDKIVHGIMTVSREQSLRPNQIQSMAFIAQGLLGNAHDNLKRAQKLAEKKGDHDMFYYFALSCFVLTRALHSPDHCDHEMVPEPGCPVCDKWIERGGR